MSHIPKLIKQMQRRRRTPLEQAKYLNAWIYGSLALSIKDRSGEGIDATLEQLNGACGHRDNLMREVADIMGWPTRRVGFHDVPIQIAHVGTEIFVENKWRFFDPTFGMYISTPDKPEEPISIQKARKLYPHIIVQRTQQAAFAGKWLKKADMKASPFEEEVLLHPLGGWPLARIAETYFLSAVTLEIPDWPHVSEMVLPLKPGEVFEFSEQDLAANHIELPYGKTYIAYAHILGRCWGRGPDVTKRFSFLLNDPVKITLTLQLRHVPLENVYASMRQAVSDFGPDAMTIEKDIGENTITWSFQATPPMTTLNLDVTQGNSAVIENMVIKAEAIPTATETS